MDPLDARNGIGCMVIIMWLCALAVALAFNAALVWLVIEAILYLRSHN